MSGPKSETPILARALLSLPLVLPRSKFWRANSGTGGARDSHRCNSINLVDIVGWQANGMALAIEVKSATGALSVEQYDFLADVKRRGGYAAVYAPLKVGGLEDFYRFPEMVPDKFLPKERK